MKNPKYSRKQIESRTDCLGGGCCMPLHAQLQHHLNHQQTGLQLYISTSTCKTVKGCKEDWTLWLVRLHHYDSLSGTSKILFFIPL